MTTEKKLVTEMRQSNSRIKQADINHLSNRKGFYN